MQTASTAFPPASWLLRWHHRFAGTAGLQLHRRCEWPAGHRLLGGNLLSILEGLLFGNGDRLPTILIGCGRLGKAVSRFITTDTNGYRLIAAFDVAQSEVGKEISGIQIRHIDELESFCAEHHPKVAVLCVPRDGAEQVSGRLVDLGIEGFWNFSHYDLSVPYPDVVVENVHLGDSLMSLGYRLRNQD